MFAVIKTGGKQYLVSTGDKIKIEKLDADEGQKVVFDQVLLTADDNGTKIGQPFIEGAKVGGLVLRQDRSKKVIVFKYKPKKRYKVKRGHRQPFSEVKIESIEA